MQRIIDKSDVLIIGAGVVGTCVARSLSKYKLNVTLVEKEEDVGFGTSKANSGIVHAGFHDRPGTKKANLCVAGNSMYETLCQELDVPFKRCGALVVALEGQRLQILEELKAQGEKNEVPGLKIIGKEALFELEPNLSKMVKAALYSPTVGVVSPYELTIALAENAKQNGVKIFLDAKVKNIVPQANGVKKVETSRGIFLTDYIINAAGLFADEIAGMVGEKFAIFPRKGEEYILDKETEGLVKHVIFPLPKEETKGVLIIPTVDGNLMVGPTAKKVGDKLDLATTREGLKEVLQQVKKIVPAISASNIVASFAGLRATSKTGDGDFVIEFSSKVRGFINLVGIDSPGLTAAPAIAETVVDLLKQEGLRLIPDKDFNPYRRWIRFHKLPTDEKDKLITKDKRYGRIICRCENVTEAEIVDAIRRGARTLDGVKFRTRAGMGRCQGGFCTPRVVEIMARELNIPPEKITKKGGKSNILWCKTKKPLEGKW